MMANFTKHKSVIQVSMDIMYSDDNDVLKGIPAEESHFKQLDLDGIILPLMFKIEEALGTTNRFNGLVL